jgi:hypothetical protein
MSYNDRKKIIDRSLMSYSESPIDQRYRLMLLEHYLEGVVEVPLPHGTKKWQFICPFCGPLAKKDYKQRQKKAALLWNAVQHSWVFTCAKKGSAECMGGKTLGNFIAALNPALGEAYRRECWHSGTTGKGHNCPSILLCLLN